MKRPIRPWLAGALLALVGIGAIRATRIDLGRRHKVVAQKHDVYFLPHPKQVVLMSLGYTYALADLLWAHVMVSQGMHTFERRRFDNLLLLFDAINELDPSWRTPYLLADALITFQTNVTPYHEVVKARAILERGVKHRPFDAEIWLNLGQFVSFVAPASYLEDDHPKIAARWRREGVTYLERAAELGAGNANISWQALGGANILGRAGEQDAMIRFLKRVYTTTDDAELKENLLKRLRKVMDKRDLLAFEDRNRAFVDTVAREFPFVGKTQALVLGPPPRPDACAGRGHELQMQCATTWRDWSKRRQSYRTDQGLKP